MASDGDKAYPPDTLGMDSAEMRRLGYAAVDAVIEHLQSKHNNPAIASCDADTLLAALGGALPEQPRAMDESFELLTHTALHHQQHGDHPRYFARVPGPSSYAAIIGEWLGVGFNSIAASWPGGAGPSAVELVVINWLCQLMGLPEDYEGVLVSGGSQASLTAIAAVRASRGPGCVYLSDQTHASLGRALRTLGFEDRHIRLLPSDPQHRLSVETVASATAKDSDKGLTPLMVIATAGSTNTGAVDLLDDLADLCKAQSLWLHIDGAYGAPAALSPRAALTLQGLRHADSLTLDPHKWLFQPYDVGCLLIRPGLLEPCFAMNPEYLKDVQASDNAVDFRNRGFELTRRSRALKLWFSFRSYGIARFREAIDYSIGLAEFAEEYLRNNPRHWEVVTPAQLGIICFALRDADAEEHERRARALSASGFACVSTTRLKERTVLRLCIINPLTTEEDIRETIDRLGA
ncbi:pyridoxal phosphate-dependent decarboxylase family protein [Congregibacter litoralis]|uniref:Glutamate decarboxylase n=1 Tax=Congregibacter litoralis KT71 TaxID=314285 RepID=A4A6I4_9GAMM|nr:aminotransferase class I/II-fold pyridoxal phosphate-dependent enzyme [Congregibacter litoralis]EAQ98631.1 Glutamate decarboxylase [Congregibacter litoralis KT71]